MQYSLNSLKKIRVSKKTFALLPQNSGVYIYWQKRNPIYIGKALNLKNRLESYLSGNLAVKTRTMIESASNLSYIKVGSELEALLLEAFLINKYQPKYNFIAKDDKHPLYIRITKERYPRVLTARKIDAKFLPGDRQIPNLAFFGPFPSSKTVYSVLRMLRRYFPYSDHKIGKKACFYHHLGLCNPCPNEIKTKAGAATYRKNIYRIKKILSGDFPVVINELNQQMHKYSEKQEYEKAGQILGKIKWLEYISQPISDINKFLENPNFLEDLRNQEISGLQNLLKISQPLTRIECFDVAHLSGTDATASQVTFINGDPEKSLYRTFRIRQIKSQDDLASMQEVARRRFLHLKDWGQPDLIIVDGGKTQADIFFRIFSREKIPVVGLAKKREILVIPGYREILLSPGPVKNLMQRIRNEAHRFAQKYHHQLMTRSLM
jgi:excinuclease ABC subunit C